MHADHVSRIYLITFESVLQKTGDPEKATAAAKAAVDAASQHAAAQAADAPAK